MTEFTCTIHDPQGLHAQPVCALAALLQKFACRVTLSCGTRSADGKDPMALMALGAMQGQTVAFSAHGSDAAQCAAAAEAFFHAM